MGESSLGKISLGHSPYGQNPLGKRALKRLECPNYLLQKYGTFVGVDHVAVYDGWPPTGIHGGHASSVSGDGQVADPTCS